MASAAIQASSWADLAGLLLSDGDDTDNLEAFDGGVTTLAAGAYAVVVDPDYDGSYSIDSAVTLLTTGDTHVGNGLTTGDSLDLFESDGSTLIATFSHPADPGDGVSMERVAVVLDASYAGEYSIPSDALLLTTDDAAIASGLAVDDPIEHYEANGYSLIDSYTFPLDAGDGVSVEKVDTSVGDIEENWEASSCSTGSSPGQGSCP